MAEGIGIVILAAGAATRMGTPKQILEFRGRPLLRHAAEVALGTRARPVVVVLGARGGMVRGALDGLPVEVVENPRWEEGVATSIQAGLDGLCKVHPEATGVILLLADQPLVTSQILEALIEMQIRTGKSIVASEYSDTVGVPVLFSRSYFPLLLALEGHQGCKGVILKHLSDTQTVPCPEAELDLDTPEDFARLCRSDPVAAAAQE
jgi:molybdenum cofactor cytidylyltransferase